MSVIKYLSFTSTYQVNNQRYNTQNTSVEEPTLQSFETDMSRGFAGRLLQLQWLQNLMIILGFSRLFFAMKHLFRHFEGQRYRAFYAKAVDTTAI